MDDITDSMSSNDRAFIKVALELRRLENSITVGESMQKMVRRFKTAERSYESNYSSGESAKLTAKNCLATTNCAEPFSSYVRFIEDFRDDFPQLDNQLTNARARVKDLRVLFDLYCEGKDIVMAKLTLDKNYEAGSE
jgi:hypothetical protein